MTDNSHRHPVARCFLPAIVLIAAVLTGCSDAASRPSSGLDRPTTTATSPSTTSTTTIAPTTTTAPPDPRPPPALTVRSDHAVDLYRDPVDPTPTRVLPARDAFGSPLALLVTEDGTGPREGWLQVLVPGRPNGGTAWLSEADVTVVPVPLEVRVDRTARMLTVMDRGQPVLTTPVAVGEPQNPTPTGWFSLTDKLDTGNPAGMYGPYALGLSARSDVLTEFAGGDGQVGIHGTNDPSSIGRAASHGCIRVPNDVAVQLSTLLPLGTPVTVF